MTRRARGRGRRAKAALNRALLAQSRGEFLRVLASVARRTGTQVLRVPAAYTSQTCPRCGDVAAENRESEAVFRCRACGLGGHADVIAALNILRRGLRALLVPGADTSGGEPWAWEATAMNRDPAECAASAA